MQNLTPTQAKYLLVINNLIKTRGYCRVTDMAKTLGITKGSVSTGNAVLIRDGLIASNEDSKMIHLTFNAENIVQTLNDRMAIMDMVNTKEGTEVFLEAEMSNFALHGTEEFFKFLERNTK